MPRTLEKVCVGGWCLFVTTLGEGDSYVMGKQSLLLPRPTKVGSGLQVWSGVDTLQTPI